MMAAATATADVHDDEAASYATPRSWRLRVSWRGGTGPRGLIRRHCRLRLKSLTKTRPGWRQFPQRRLCQTVLTDTVGKVEIAVPRDGAAANWRWPITQRCLNHVDEIVLLLYAKGLTFGEIAAHSPDATSRMFAGSYQPNHRQHRATSRPAGTSVDPWA